MSTAANRDGLLVRWVMVSLCRVIGATGDPGVVSHNYSVEPGQLQTMVATDREHELHHFGLASLAKALTYGPHADGP